jgi:hypothetical protein
MCDRPQAAAAIPKTDAAPPAELLDGPGSIAEEVEDKKWEIPMSAIRDIAGHPDPVVTNPIVDAAADYAKAQRAAEIAMRRVETLKLELQQAENSAQDAAADRDFAEVGF